MSCADKPLQSLIIPDTILSGSVNIERYPVEDGPVPGVVAAESSNLGRCFPVQKGRLVEGAVDHHYEITKAGGIGSGEFVYRTENDFSYSGTHDPRRFWGWQSGDPNPVSGTKNIFIEYSELNSWTIIGNVDPTTSLVTIRRKLDQDGYFGIGDEWQVYTAFTLQNQIIPTGDRNCVCVVGSDGRLVLMVRVLGHNNYGPAEDIDVYHSVDGGLNWTLASERIISAFTVDNSYEPHNYNSQIRSAVSGEFIRLCYANTAGKLITWLSRDRGITWQRLTLDTAAGDLDLATIVPFVSDPHPYDLIGIGNGGLFLLMIRNPAVSNDVLAYDASGTARWSPMFSGIAVFTPPHEIFQISMVATNDYIYMYVNFRQGGGPEDGWMLCRSTPQLYKNFFAILPSFPGWEISTLPNNTTGMNFVGSGTQARWCGDKVTFFSGVRSGLGTGTEEPVPALWYQGGWDKYSVGLSGPTTRLDQSQSVNVGATGPFMYTDYWNPMVGDPTTIVGTSWAKSLGGGGAAIFSSDRVTFAGGGIGDDAKIQKLGMLPTNMGEPDSAAMIGFTVRLEPFSGDAFQPLTPNNDFIGVKVINSMSTGNGDFSVRLQYDGIRLVSYGASGPTDQFLPFNLTEWTEVRVSVQTDSTLGLIQIQLMAKVVNFDFWQVSPPIIQSFTGGPTPNSEIYFGNVDPQNAPSPWVSHWREFWVTSRMDDSRVIINPTAFDLFGLPLSPNALLTERGMFVAWTGSSAALTDSFVGTVEHTYPLESILSPSPRVQWRSTNVASMFIPSNDFDPSFGWAPARVAGVTNVTANVETDPFGVPNNADQIQFSDLASHARIPAISYSVFPEEHQGHTLCLWIKLVSSAPPGPEAVSFTLWDGVTTAPVVLTPGWQYIELDIVAGANPIFFDVNIENYQAGTIYTFSMYEVWLKPQTYFIMNSKTPNGDLNRFDHNSVSFFGSNIRKWIVDYSELPDFSVVTLSASSDSAVYGTDASPLIVTSVNECEINFAPITKIIRGSLIGKYIRFTSGVTKTALGESTWEVVKHESDGTFLVKPRFSSSPQSVGVAPGDTFVVFNGKSAAFFEAPARSKYVRVRAFDPDVSTTSPGGPGVIELGVMQLGKRLQIDVPMDWTHTDNEQPNITSYRTRGAVSWAYREGPPQRTIIGRVVGDVQRFREKFRFIMRYLEYETRPLTLILDGDSIDPVSNPSGPDENLVLCRITSGSQHDQAAWYIDSDGVLRTAGDMSITFVEEV